VQWEFAGRLGPPPGRYVLRRFAGDDVHEVVVVTELGEVAAPRRRRRPRRAPAEPPAPPVPVTRVTVVAASPLSDPDSWLAGAAGDPRVVAEAAAALARLVGAHRVAAAQPLADPDPEAALAARIGYATGAQVADGAWESALDLAPAARPRGRLGRPPAPPSSDRLAALLAARDVPLACEELTLRARADIDHERPREAALQLEAALTTALAELACWTDRGDLGARVEELRGYAPAVRAAAAAAREGRLEAAGVDAVTAALARLEAALRARALNAT
jgi:hypothetical protein